MMTPYQAIQAMNKGYKWAVLNVKKNKIISLHKEYDKAWSRVKRGAAYKWARARQDAGLPLTHDDWITHDVISLFDIAFSK